MQINKILIIRNGAIGDVVHTTGLFRAIKKAYPQIHIDYATSCTVTPLLKNDKDLNEVFVFEDYSYKYFSLERMGIARGDIKEIRFSADTLGSLVRDTVRFICEARGI